VSEKLFSSFAKQWGNLVIWEIGQMLPKNVSGLALL
jgi:hypothetical protein